MQPASGMSDRLDAALDGIDEAALGLRTWPAALEQVRDLMECRVAQVLGVGKMSAAPFNWSTEAQDWRELVAVGGTDLRVNSRRRTSLTLPLLTVCDEASFDTEADRSKNPDYGQFLQRWDYSYVCLAPVARAFDVTVNLSVTRNSGQGGLNTEAKRLFASLARRVRHAVRTQEMLQRRSLERIVATFDQMSQAAFACDGEGRILTCTPQGEALIAAGDRLFMKDGRLSARTRHAAAWLSGVIASGCSDRKTIPASHGVVQDVNGARPLVLEIIPIPARASDFWDSAAVLVVARDLDATRAAARLARLGATIMGFTPAEEAVARDLLAGRSPSDTAENLGIAVGTVRVHVRNIYAKAEVRNQLAFAALMGALR